MPMKLWCWMPAGWCNAEPTKSCCKSADSTAGCMTCSLEMRNRQRQRSRLRRESACRVTRGRGGGPQILLVHSHVFFRHAGMGEPPLRSTPTRVRVELVDRASARDQVFQSVPQLAHILRDDLGQRPSPGAQHGRSAHHAFDQGEAERLVPQCGHPETL